VSLTLMNKELKFNGKIVCIGPGYGFRVPKVLVDMGVFEVGKTYRFRVEEVVELKENKY
jgi:hypothetical protein